MTINELVLNLAAPDAVNIEYTITDNLLQVLDMWIGTQFQFVLSTSIIKRKKHEFNEIQWLKISLFTAFINNTWFDQLTLNAINSRRNHYIWIGVLVD